MSDINLLKFSVIIVSIFSLFLSLFSFLQSHYTYIIPSVVIPQSLTTLFSLSLFKSVCSLCFSVFEFMFSWREEFTFYWRKIYILLERVSHVASLEKNIPGRGDSQGKGPGVAICLVYWLVAYVFEGKWGRERIVRQEVRDGRGAWEGSWKGWN